MASDGTHGDERPTWARRMRAERQARGWSQTDAVRALASHTEKALPSTASLLRNWKRWEAGEVEPDDFYKPLIAKTFGTVSAAFFPRQGHRDGESELLSATGMNTLELVSRLRVSDVSPATLDALRITADRLCSEYPYMSPDQLSIEGHAWLRRICSLLDRRLTLSQHREVLSLAGTVSLLIGCVEYDMGRRRDARATRRAALSLGEEAGDADVMGWAHEMAAWFAITQGQYRGVIAAANAGEFVASHRSVTVQLAAQRAKAWARIGDRREMEKALDQGRAILETLPYPEDVDHHFVVDPSKFDFYAMDCYRLLGDNERARVYADEVIRSSTDLDGTPRKPMRIAEAEITLGVVAAREGDIEQAVALGQRAISGERKSLPSLLMVSGELRQILAEKYPSEQQAAAFLEELQSLGARD
ncbi:XRE family transcriptional regulator [Micromonospora musae]|uniref:XRE family transcriptional regulator n=1 Tax=Micromonospora musae TaxID=1894970 RepID=UPI003421C5FD